MQDKSYAENEVFEQMVSLDNKEILELGCGTAAITRLIASNGHGRKIVATEVDEVQHSRNLLIDDLPNVTFVKAGGEEIPFDDESFDVVAMFSSLHHVPIEMMSRTLSEIRRVLKPSGLAYIVEPVFAGDLNEMIRCFHDEEVVRAAAYSALKDAIKNEHFTHVEEVFFDSPFVYQDFEEFDRTVINVTHTEHNITPELYQTVKDQFMSKMQADGAKFLIPFRVNLLQKKD